MRNLFNVKSNGKVMFPKWILVFLLIGFFAVPISALSVTISSPSFNIGDEVMFNYTFLSSSNENITYSVTVQCPSIPAPLGSVMNMNLVSGVPQTKTYSYISNLTDKWDPQTCSAIVGSLTPEKVSASKSFSIITNPSMSFNVSLCKDQSCNTPAKVFAIGEKVYVNYDSSVNSPSIVSNLILPDGTSEKVTLPYSFEATQTGTYILEVNASKSGYKEISKSIEFGIISKESSIGYTNLNQLSSNENSFPWSLLILLIAVLIIAAVIIIVLKYKKK